MKVVSLCILLLAANFFTRAQTEAGHDSIRTTPVIAKVKQPKSLSMVVSFFNHSISVPFHKIISTPLHPGVQVGIEGRYFQNKRSKLFQTLNMGMFYNKFNGKGFYLNTEFAYRYTSKPGLFAEVLVGMGYMITYHPTDIFKLDNSGTYQKARDTGFSSFIVSFAFGLGYAVKSSSAFSFAPFIRYESLIQTRYNEVLGVLPQSAFHVGLRINKTRVK